MRKPTQGRVAMTKNATVSPSKLCKYVNPEGERCERGALAHELCWTHYQQERRGKPLSDIRPRGLVLLPGNIRVRSTDAEALKERVTAGLARSLYEATRHAIEAGVAAWARKKAKLVAKAT
jgi:hypothetical protein